MSHNKTHCRYCGGVTFDDMRGNCGACGAPRNWKDYEEHLWDIGGLRNKFDVLPSSGVVWEYEFTIRVGGV
jgi:ribosomal protein L37E